MKKQSREFTILFFGAALLLKSFLAIGQDRYSVASGNWSNTLTWSASPGGAPGASVPTAGDNVYISNGHEVSVDAIGYCLNLTVGQGISGILNIGRRTTQPTSQQLIVNGNILVNTGAAIIPRRNNEVHTLTLRGNLINHGAADFGSTRANGPVCNVTLNGVGDQTIGGTVPVSFNNLTIGSGSNTTLVIGEQTIRGILLVNGTLNTSGYLTLLSTDVKTALIDGSGTGAVTGSITMQRYLASGFGYKYISSPFQAATVEGLGDDMDLAAEFPTFYSYDESLPLSGWVSFTNPANILSPLAGYAVNFGSAVAPKTIDLTGDVNNGDLTISLNNHDNPYTKGFNLVGNPYPSPVNWNAAGWTKVNIDNALYYFRAGTVDEYSGTYSSYVNGVSSDGVASNIIPSMQGFFVHVTDGTFPVSGTLGVTNSVRVNNMTQPFLKSAGASSRFLVRMSAAFADDSIASADPLVVYFDDAAGSSFDSELDALKMFNTDWLVTNFYSVISGGRRLSVNALPLQADTALNVPLGLTSYRDGEVCFRLLTVENLPEGVSILFRDSLTGAIIRMPDAGEYRVNLPAGDYNNRFLLTFLKSSTGVSNVQLGEEVFSAFNSGGMVKATVFALDGPEGQITVYDMNGIQVVLKSVFETGQFDIPVNLKPGIYLVKFRSGSLGTTIKMIMGLQ
ncbi:T9SS type A sorting domain-containing protein [bacterium]|nr:T9SS type A sorting domain-containing protein [bacterium]